jgi:hypothetical protein
MREEYVKRVFGEQSQQWHDVRDALLRHDDVKLKERAVKFKDFLDRNNEKATKAFCRLSKEGGVCDDVSQIKNEEGRPFNSDSEREEYIGKFYSNIYKKRLDNLLKIEEFLYSGIEGEGRFEGQKLNDDERNELEQEITMEEVKKALDGSNFESSSGWDGVTFRAIRKYWVLLCEPMLKMIQETFRERELMETFKLGLIKMIPKKGEAIKVGDWRPITLLCCGYKLISGIVANRLGKYLNKMIGRAQKGFMINKNINSCTINVMNSISRAWETRKPTGIMCVDFAKAFNSVEHGMIRGVMKFFGFGLNMTEMVMTLLNGRKSRIIFENGYSFSIEILRGTPQGDRSSPYIFILCIEILLMRLNLMEGRGIDESGIYIEVINLDNSLEPSTGEAYADDLTIIFKMGEDGVRQILKLLKDFEKVSGLEINIGKTQLMVAGCDEWRVGMRVMEIEIVDKVTILGVTIDRKLEELDANWDKAIVKMRRLAGYWSLFGLSITGRVMVAKTYIMSQCIYLMGSLPLSRTIGDRINEVLVNFVKGRDRLIERRRQLLCTSLGGYGLVDVNLMNVCMKAVWIERLKGEGLKNDYMAAIIWNGEHGLEAWRVNRARVEGKGFRITEDIVKSWTLFVNVNFWNGAIT